MPMKPGLEPQVQLAAGGIGDGGPDRTGEQDALFGLGNAALLAAVAVVLDDQDRLVAALG